MKSATLHLLSLLFVTFTIGQTKEGYINDPDGYTNVRQGMSSKTKIVTTLNEGELFSYQESVENKWWKVTKSNGKSGYVHCSRIEPLSTKIKEIDLFFKKVMGTKSSNAEFSSTSNEMLFEYAQKFPKAFVSSLYNKDKSVRDRILSELKSPIHDMIDLKLVYKRIHNSKSDARTKSEVMRSLVTAGKKINLDVTRQN